MSNQIDWEQYSSKIYIKYSVKLDETSLTILYILQQEQSAYFSQSNNTINNAVSKLKSANQSLEVDNRNPRWQAFWFGMGKMGVTSILLVIAIAIAIYSKINNQRQLKQLDSKLLWYKIYYQKTLTKSKAEVAEFLKHYPKPKE